MAKARWCGDQIYTVAQSFVEDCLLQDGSLFTPDAAIWKREHIEPLDGRVGSPEPSEGSFVGKLVAQLEGLEAEEVQLCAELLFVMLLAELDTGGPKKREHVSTILGTLPVAITIPPLLDTAFDAGGVANFSTAKSYRHAHMRFYVRLLLRLKACPIEEREAFLSAPWAFRGLVEEERSSTDAMSANALLHLLFPETFEYIISPGHRTKLVETFSAAPGVAEAENTDRQIQVIRELASNETGRDLDLYEDPFQRIWKDPVPPRWEEAVRWGLRLYQRDDFDETERIYKLDVATKIAVGRDALLAGRADWLDGLRRAFGDRVNNLTSWRAHDDFLRWCETSPDAARETLNVLWSEEQPDESALRRFLDALPNDAVSGPGTRVSIASFLLMGVDATRFPFFKPTVYQTLRKALGLTRTHSVNLDPETVYRPEELAARLGLDGRRVREFLRATYPREESERGADWYLTAEQAEGVIEEFSDDIDLSAGHAAYAEWVTLLEELRLRMLVEGARLRDLLDAQGVAWWLVQGPVPNDWTTEDRAALHAFRKGVGPPTPTGDDVPRAPVAAGAGLPLATHELAAQLHLPQSWLQKLLALLQEKRQLILYGPPGTGKTFVAQHIGKHVAGAGGSFRLVQFHPSYTYEDFFEGYRPQPHDEGALSFELVPGTLRDISAEATANPERPYLLIIDEINRGNIAKIFGELYFLLEYRDQAIQLQYSRGELFQLPENLYVIGTMNTADRSIALVDSALRRRFYFMGLMPTRDPINRVLGEWLAAHDLDPEPAALLDTLNREIADEEFSIGPSYFMTSDGGAPDIERVWRYSIMPLLEEHYYGTGRDLEADFGLAAIRKRIAVEADAEPETNDDDLG